MTAATVVNFEQLYEGHEVHRAERHGFGRSHRRIAAEVVKLASAEQQGSFGSRNIRGQKHPLLPGLRQIALAKYVFFNMVFHVRSRTAPQMQIHKAYSLKSFIFGLGSAT